ncbi:MAG: FtsB family cell division protein [Bacillota bacterium]
MVKARRNISSIQAARRPQASFLARWMSDKRMFIIIALVFLLFILIPLAKNYSRKRLVEKEIQGIQAEIADFEAKNKDLREMIDYLQSDQSLEEQARLNMGLKRPGETVAVITESEPGIALPEKDQEPARSNYSKWIEYFLD